MTEDVDQSEQSYRLPDNAGSPGWPFSLDDLPGLVAKGRTLGLSDEVLAIQLRLTPEELMRIEAGDQASLAAVVPGWQKRIRNREKAR